MDSILWFHLECPKAASKFDNPIEFKRKFRDFFAETRTALENINYLEPDQQRVKDQYNFIAYPEDVKEHKEFRQFKESFDQYSPVLRPDSEDDYENEDLDEVFDAEIDIKETAYGKLPQIAETRPLTKSESLKHPQKK